MENARLIIDPPLSGGWNMAIDQALLETANQTGQITLRFYSWSEPTLSLGYFQSHSDRGQHPISSTCPLVRRRTGGGAILHDREITYSLCIPSAHRWSQKNSQLYEMMHRQIIQLLANHGVASRLYEAETSRNRNTSPEATRPFIDNRGFLCFQRRSPGDVILDEFKIVGSAQRRIKNALLQHGSILQSRSEWAPELPGINDLAGLNLSDREVAHALAAATEKSLNINLIPGQLSNSEKEASKSAYSLQFDSDDWNLRR